MSTKKKPTINDVARLANVSKKTVSRVINASPRVTPETRFRVQSVIQKLKYAPDPQARGLNTKRSYLLGLVYDNPNALYISDIQKGIIRACQGTGYELVMHPGEFASDQLVSDINFFVSRARLDGVILLSPISQLQNVANSLKRAKCPYVRISPTKIDSVGRVVVSNDRLGAQLMTDYLIGLGHQTIGFIQGPKSNLSAEEKFRGFCDALDRNGIPLRKRLVVQGENTFQSGEAAAEQLLSRQVRPSAIFASNDEMALGVLKTARMRNVSVPEDISVAGFDDSAFASVVWPDLTTIHQPVESMGELAAQKLIASLSESDIDFRESVVIKPELVVRNSTATPNPKR